MTKTAARARILELFGTLPARDQRALAERLSETAREQSHYDRLSPEDRAELDEAIAEADRGDTIPADEAFNDLAQRYGFSRA
jgi:hypothetical protein